MKKTLFLIFAVLFFNNSYSQKKQYNKENYDSQKVFLITIDGLRWQEVFTGAEKRLLNEKDFMRGQKDAIKKLYWRNSAKNRREVLMPFFWNTLAKKGQIYGNRLLNSKVNVYNTMWFSYPGYNEILCGFADNKNINSNAKKNNPNKTILEIANNLPTFKGKIGAFGSWDVFPFIINEERSGIYVNAGYRKAKGNDLTEKEKYLNHLQKQAIKPWGSVRQDVFTHNYALEFIKKKQPKLLYIAYGETDDFAHNADYTHYLLSTENTDQMIKELWEYCQSNGYYKNKTTFIITTDHGRGDEELWDWLGHGKEKKHSDQTWIAVIGPNIKPKGEMKNSEQLYNKQIVRTIKEILKIPYDKNKKPLPILK